MSIRLLEHIRDELRVSGAIQNTPEFCTGWLGRSEGYIRTLRFHQIEPSVEALSVRSYKLGHYADKLRDSDTEAHKIWVQSFDGLKSLCDQVIAKQAHQIWRDPDRMRA
jgi:hypothetical protein